MGVRNPTNPSKGPRENKRKGHTLIISQRIASGAPRKEGKSEIFRKKTCTKNALPATASGFLRMEGDDRVGFGSSSLPAADEWWFLLNLTLSRSEFVGGRK
ncbi:hypothetical protein Pyn_07456 [Prunus yedoensis var. nudiflora]|uniref:Uncharacterized protein n=1 Tax=Prunus yedoensis var. nudiflora TaxID=2094558 RepID=A0A314XV05_PRUYE|nr:hypothetical protein Pyn_07456 [Prunus yedoensis var. nudiflora]